MLSKSESNDNQSVTHTVEESAAKRVVPKNSIKTGTILLQSTYYEILINFRP